MSSTTKKLSRLWQRGCEFLGTEYALLGGAMTWVSERNLVSAISNAGGFGVIATGAMAPDMLREEIQATQKLTSKPYGVNLITMHPQLDELIQVCADEKMTHVVLAGGLPPRSAIEQLKSHAPYTALGAATGIIVMVIVVVGKIPTGISQTIFYSLHPIHILLSALTTTSMYIKYRSGKIKIWMVVLVGWTGSLGIATISDAIIPYFGAVLLQVPIEFHVPFVENWWLSLLAIIGIIMGYKKQTTKIPHFGHVLLSTWASLFYFVAFGMANWIPLLPFIFLFLFIAVWIPCCASDIIYPLLFASKTKIAVSARRGSGNSV